MAVYPAVPMAIACRAEKLAGSGTSHSPLTRASSARPPQCVSPTPQPLRTTRSPTFQAAFAVSVTVPAKSIPGTIGKRRTTGDLPVSARPSL
jgi:hypothetical protein